MHTERISDINEEFSQLKQLSLVGIIGSPFSCGWDTNSGEPIGGKNMESTCESTYINACFNSLRDMCST